MKQIVFIFTTLLVFNCINPVVAQKNKKLLEKADSIYNTLKYSQALDIYRKAYAKTSSKERDTKGYIMFQVAMCYKKMNDNQRAVSWFKRAVSYNYKDPIARYYYATTVKAMGDYDKAIEALKAYQDANPEDTSTNLEIQACELAKKWIENPTRYEIENDELRRINSRENDFCPDYADSKYRTFIFTSSRDGSMGSGKDDWTGESFQDLYFVKKDRKLSWKTPIPFTEAINSEHNEGGASLNENGTEIYFTRCLVEKKKQMGCQIYKAKKSGKDWQEAELFPVIDDSTATVGHPALSPDEDILYFVSDMKGGYGGKDIWMVEIDGVKPGEPKNLGPIINTPKDEMFPYVAKDGVLYFASDGHMGMGGLDIFKTEKIDGEWSKPENMKYPVNSSYDDFGIVLEETNDKGFICSNRKGSRGGDDVWELYLPPLVFTMHGIVYDDSTKEIINNATVKISGTDGTSYIAYTDIDGKYFFNEMQIQPNTTYDLAASFKSYFTETGKETTIGIERNKDIEHDFYLKRIPDQPIELPEILYDFAKWDLKPQYQDSLNGLIKTMNDNPTFIIELASHTDSRASLDYNDTLSQKRAQSVVDYLIQKGIAADRMVARGYGERIPKELKKTVIYPQVELKQGAFMKNDTIISGVSIKKGLLYTDLTIDSVVFEKGTVLDETFINSLTTNRQKELAHQLNRRTEFSVISEDYVPKDDGQLNIPQIQIIREDDEGNENK